MGRHFVLLAALFLVPLIASVSAVNYYCQWTWPQKVINKDTSAVLYPCPSAHPYCNKDAAFAGAPQCCQYDSNTKTYYECVGTGLGGTIAGAPVSAPTPAATPTPAPTAASTVSATTITVPATGLAAPAVGAVATATPATTITSPVVIATPAPATASPTASFPSAGAAAGVPVSGSAPSISSAPVVMTSAQAVSASTVTTTLAIVPIAAITASGQVDFCYGIACGGATKVCPDGVEVRCAGTCDKSTGACASCEPSCAGHERAVPIETIVVPVVPAEGAVGGGQAAAPEGTAGGVPPVAGNAPVGAGAPPVDAGEAVAQHVSAAEQVVSVESTASGVSVTTVEKKLLFGLIPVDVETTKGIGAGNNVVSMQRPWWDFLAWGSPSTQKPGGTGAGARNATYYCGWDHRWKNASCFTHNESFCEYSCATQCYFERMAGRMAGSENGTGENQFRCECSGRNDREPADFKNATQEGEPGVYYCAWDRTWVSKPGWAYAESFCSSQGSEKLSCSAKCSKEGLRGRMAGSSPGVGADRYRCDCYSDAEEEAKSAKEGVYYCCGPNEGTLTLKQKCVAPDKLFEWKAWANSGVDGPACWTKRCDEVCEDQGFSWGVVNTTGNLQCACYGKVEKKEYYCCGADSSHVGVKDSCAQTKFEWKTWTNSGVEGPACWKSKCDDYCKANSYAGGKVDAADKDKCVCSIKVEDGVYYCGEDRKWTQVPSFAHKRPESFCSTDGGTCSELCIGLGRTGGQMADSTKCKCGPKVPPEPVAPETVPSYKCCVDNPIEPSWSAAARNWTDESKDCKQGTTRGAPSSCNDYPSAGSCSRLCSGGVMSNSLSSAGSCRCPNVAQVEVDSVLYCCGADQSHTGVKTVCYDLKFKWDEWPGSGVEGPSCWKNTCDASCKNRGYGTGTPSQDKYKCVCSDQITEGLYYCCSDKKWKNSTCYSYGEPLCEQATGGLSCAEKCAAEGKLGNMLGTKNGTSADNYKCVCHGTYTPPPKPPEKPKTEWAAYETGSGSDYDYHSGSYQYGSESGRTKGWIYSFADAPANWGKDSAYSRFRVFDSKLITVQGPAGEYRAADVNITVWYAGTIDDLSSGVSAAGGAVSDYSAKIKVGMKGRWTRDWDKSMNTVVWQKASNAFYGYLEVVAETWIGALIGEGVGALGGELASNVVGISMTVAQQGHATTSCTEQVERTQTVEFKDVYLMGGQDYEAFISLDGVTKEVAIGLACGYVEIDFYNKKPRNCDDDGKEIAARGIQVKDVKVTFK